MDNTAGKAFKDTGIPKMKHVPLHRQSQRKDIQYLRHTFPQLCSCNLGPIPVKRHKQLRLSPTEGCQLCMQQLLGQSPWLHDWGYKRLWITVFTREKRKSQTDSPAQITNNLLDIDPEPILKRVDSRTRGRSRLQQSN